MTIPNPGSEDAVNAGCTCPVLDNNRGLWAPMPGWADNPPNWWMVVGCPLHDPDSRGGQ